MSGSKGFSLSVGLVDNASKNLDAITKRIQAMQAPAERFNKSMTKFAQVSGVARVTEGIKSLGDSALESARALERMAGPLALLGTTSVAGALAMAKAWGDAGNTIKNTAYVLELPIGKLTALQRAANLAGVSTDAMDGSLSKMQDALRAVAYHQGTAEQVQLLNYLGIDAGTPGHVTDVSVAMGALADKVKDLKEPGAQAHLLDEMLGGHELLPMLKNGKAGLEELQRQAKATGATMSEEMGERATALSKAFNRIGLDFVGIKNHIMEDVSPALTSVLGTTSDWIEKNQTLAKSFSEIGIAAGTVTAGVLGSWVWKRLLGLGASAAGAATGGAEAGAAAGAAGGIGLGAAVPLTLPLALSGDAGPNSGVSPEQEARNRAAARAAGALTPGEWWERNAPWWLGGSSPHQPGGAALPGPRTPSAGSGPRGIRNNNPLNLSYLPGQGADHSDGRFGVYPTMEAGIAANARQIGLDYNTHGQRTLASLIGDSVHGWSPASDPTNPTGSTAAYIRAVSRDLGIGPNDDIGSYVNDPARMAELIRSMSRVENAGRVPSDDQLAGGLGLGAPGGRPLPTPMSPFRMDGNYAADNPAPTANVKGGVHVTVSVQHNGTSASANATATGHATTAPPTVETSMASAY